MILTPAEYHQIAPANSFTRPPNLGVLVPNPAGTAAQIASAEDTHRLTKKIYLETLLLKRTIIQKIIEAVYTKYLSTLCNPITRTIMPLVLIILDFLYNNYGCINTQQLDNKTTTVKSTTYGPSQQINIIFNSIDDLFEYARAAKAELTQSHTIKLALVILHRQHPLGGRS